MSDREKVSWWRALLVILSPGFGSLLLLSVGSPASASPESFRMLLLVFLIPTAVYLLVLSWRAAYLSGRNKR